MYVGKYTFQWILFVRHVECTPHRKCRVWLGLSDSLPLKIALVSAASVSPKLRSILVNGLTSTRTTQRWNFCETKAPGMRLKVFFCVSETYNKRHPKTTQCGKLACQHDYILTNWFFVSICITAETCCRIHGKFRVLRLLSIISHIKKKSKRRTPIFKQNKTSSFTSLTNFRETKKSLKQIFTPIFHLGRVGESTR